MAADRWPDAVASRIETPRLGPTGLGENGAPAAMPARRILRAYAEQADFDIMRHVRAPGFLLPALLFPALLYGAFLYAAGTPADQAVTMFWLADYTSFVAIVPGLYLFALSAADDRASSLAQWQRVLPLPPGAPLIGQLILASLVAGLGALALLAVTWVMGGILPSSGSAASLVGTAALCSLPFSLLGLLVGTMARGKTAIVLVHALLLPLVVASGLLIPPQLLPAAWLSVSAFSPGHDVLVLVLGAVRPDLPAGPWHFVYLLIFALLLGGLARWRARQPED